MPSNIRMDRVNEATPTNCDRRQPKGSLEFVRKLVPISKASDAGRILSNTPVTTVITSTITSPSVTNTVIPFVIRKTEVSENLLTSVPSTPSVPISAWIPSTANVVCTTATVTGPRIVNRAPVNRVKPPMKVIAQKKKRTGVRHSNLDCGEWSSSASEALIEMFKQRWFFYDSSNKFCLNKILKKGEAFAEIAEGLSCLRPNTTPQEVKGKLISLKNEFLQELRCLLRAKKLSTSTNFIDLESLASRYWVFPRMKFVLPFIKEGLEYLAPCKNHVGDSTGYQRGEKDETSEPKENFGEDIHFNSEKEQIMHSFFNYLLTEYSQIQDQDIRNSLKLNMFNAVVESVQLDISKRMS